MSMTAAQQTEAYRFFAIAFRAAPGVEYMNQIADAYAGGASTKQIVNEFVKKSVFTNQYPSFLTREQFADRLVENVVGSSATAAAKTEAKADIVGALAAGATRGDVIFQVFTNLASLTSDAKWGGVATKLNNQVAVSRYYTETLLKTSSDVATLQAVLAGVTETTDVSAAALEARLNVQPAQTFTLTTGVDSVTGGAGNDTVLGTIDTGTAANNTFSTADVVNGGSGTDTLQISVSTLGAATTVTPTNITNVENFRVINSSANDITVDLGVTTGETGVEASSSSRAVTFSNIDSAAVALSANSNTATVTFNIPATKLTGTADAITVNLTSNTGSVLVNSATNAAGIESATINATGTNSGGNYIGAAADMTTLTVTGTGSLVIAAADMTALKTLNASANSGGVTYDATALNVTLTGGSGNDTLTDGAGNDVINGGAGNDTINGGNGNDNINAGDGNDTVVLSTVTKDESVDGGAGTDTLSVGSAFAFSATAGTDDSVNVKNFETLTFTSATAVTQNMTGLSANNTIATYVIGGAGAATLQNVAGLTTVTGSTTGTVTLGLRTNGTSDTLAVSVGNATAAASRTVNLNATQYETLNVSSVGADGNTLTLGTTNAGDGVTAATAASATQLKTLTITGNKSLTVNGSTVDTALATINAADFTGASLSVSGFGSTSAMTVTATGAYNATIEGGNAADNITAGSGNDNLSGGAGADTISGGLGNDTISGGTGANVLLGGAGNDSITGGADADNADGGDGNDTIVGSDGANTLAGGAGNDSITAGTGNDNITGGDGNDTISSGSGADTVDAGAGDDSVTASAGNDNVSGGAGSDTIDAGTGDDTVSGGDGNDFITISSLSNGDSIDGGNGTDRLTIAAISSDATPSGVSGVEDFRITSIGGGATSITVDLTKVTGITEIRSTVNQDNAQSLTVRNLPSTVTTISLADTGGTTDTNAFSYSSGPSSLALNAFANVAGATNVTSLNAPLTITGRLTTDIAGEAQLYDATLRSSLGTITTDATTMTITTDALSAPVANTELTVGDITNNVIQSLVISGQSNADITVGTLNSSSPELATVSVTAGASATTTIGDVTASGATALTVTTNTGAQGILNLGAVTAASAALTVSGTLGDQSSIADVADIFNAKSITSSSYTVGAGVGTSAAYEALPTLRVNATTGTIGSVTVNAGTASYVEQSIGSGGSAPATIGAISAQGTGNVKITVAATNAPTNPDDATLSAMSSVSASTMTSPLSSFHFVGTSAAARMTITGGAGNDTLIGGTGADTITGGAGADVLTSTGGNDIFVFTAGTSNAVFGGAGASDGQDHINDWATGDLLRFTIASVDTTWDMNHILVGAPGGGATTATAGSNDGAVTSYATTTVLVQTGAVAANDGFDYAVKVTTNGTAAAFADAPAARAAAVINLTGTIGDDTLTTGANNDTINGGAGNDTIDGGDGADNITGGTGNDSLTGGAGADTIGGSEGDDRLIGGTGADRLTGGDGNDVYVVAAGSTELTIGGTGDSGTISGFDDVRDFRLGTSTLVAESLDMASVAEAVVANTAGTNGTDSTLTIGGATIKSHAITSGIVTFSNADTFATALTLTSTAHLAAVVQYLQANDLGDAGATVAFVVGSDTYVFMQGDNDGTNASDVLVKLTGVTGTAVSATNAATAGLIDIGG